MRNGFKSVHEGGEEEREGKREVLGPEVASSQPSQFADTLKSAIE